MNEFIDLKQLDLLVDGELDEPARAELLRRIESTPDGWRLCASAFLEAGEFALASRAWRADQRPIRAEPVAVRPVRKRFATPGKLGLAASILALAFLGGYAVRGGAKPPVAIARSTEASVESDVPPTPIEAPTGSDATVDNPPPTVIPEYVRSEWESRGYRIEQKRRFVSMELGGGGRVTIPFDDVEFRFVGRPTY